MKEDDIDEVTEAGKGTRSGGRRWKELIVDRHGQVVSGLKKEGLLCRRRQIDSPDRTRESERTRQAATRTPWIGLDWTE